MHPNHHRMLMLTHRGMGLHLKMHRLKGCGYGSKSMEDMFGCGAHKKMEGGKLKRKPLSFRF